MYRLWPWILWCGTGVLFAQKPCASTEAWTPCGIELEMSAESAAKHANPYLSVDVWAEIRSPEFRTYRMPAFWDGGRRLVIRFTPTEPGEWTFRTSGNLPEFEEKSGVIKVAPSEMPGFIRPANVHHWIHPATIKPHLYLGDSRLDAATMPAAAFDAYLQARADAGVTHIRLLVLTEGAFHRPDEPNPDYFRELDRRLFAINQKGLIADLVLANRQGDMQKRFPEPAQRERYLKYLVSRYAPLNITWQLVQEFESYENAKPFLRDLGGRIRALDPYNHPRSAHAMETSSSLAGDNWIDHLMYGSTPDALGTIEHQIYPAPQIRTGLESSDADVLRRQLWNATMNGQYPVLGGEAAPSLVKHWTEFFRRTRYWELEPYFDVENCRAIALPDVEYIAYIEKPGTPVEITVEKHEYQVYWMNPATGVITKEKKDWKGDVFTGAPPDPSHDWVLHLSRDGRKQSMAKSYKFESRRNLMQEVEGDARLIPYALETPNPATPLIPGREIPFAIKLKKTTPGTRRMTYVITGEIVRDGQGLRMLAHGSEGKMMLPPGLLRQADGVLNLRVLGLNAPGKLYSLDFVFPVKKADP